MMLLSILIPTIPERSRLFERLQSELNRQLDAFTELHWEFLRDHGGIEIISDASKRFLEGGKTIGAKRGDLLQRSTGKYICFLDDDEDIAPNYLETLARMCAHDKDCVSFRCLFKNDHYWTVIDMSLHHKRNDEATPHRIVKRLVWHVCPVKRELAIKEGFSEISHNEDWDWMSRVLPNIKSEIHTNQILTQYNHSAKTSEADKIIQQGHK